MKAGTLILIIILMVFAFGFVLKDDLETHQQTQGLQNQIYELTRQLEQTEALLNTCLDEKTRDEQTIEELRKVIEAQKAMIDELNKQIADLSFQNALLESQQTVLDFFKTNPLLLIGAILVPMTTTAIRYSRKISRLPLRRLRVSQDEYIRLSTEELAHIISRRRYGDSRE